MTKQPSLLAPADDLTQVLGPDLAAHFLAHRKALKKPMTAFAAQLMAKKLRGFTDPVAAVEQSILRGWSDCYPVEQNRQQQRNIPTARGVEALRADLERRIMDDEQQGTPSARGGDLEADRGLSLLGWQGNARPH